MRVHRIGVIGGCLFGVLPVHATWAEGCELGASAQETSSTSSSLDIWDELEEAMRLLCMLIGCTIERSDRASASADVEQQGWTIVLSYAVNGVRSDISPVEATKGRDAAEKILNLLEANPNLVSGELRPYLSSTAASISQELAP